MGMTLPAIQSARHKARSLQCRNNLRQLGLATITFESQHRHFPTNGWGYAWVGDPNRGTGRQQCGGWDYSILPYIETKAVWELGSSATGDDLERQLSDKLKTSVSLLACPSRHGNELTPFLGQVPLRNAWVPQFSFKSDYAGSGGSVPQENLPGPIDDSAAAVREHFAARGGTANGIFFAGSLVRLAEVTDGLSHTYLIGEKFVRTRPALFVYDRDFGNDQSAFLGDDHDNRRWANLAPSPDSDEDHFTQFGSRHGSGWHAVLCDGSIHAYDFHMSLETHQQLANRKDE